MDGRRQSLGLIGVAALCLAAAVVSVVIQDFHYGINNNLFHVPIVLGWDRDPVFADDHFIQSLRYYVSGVWPLVALVGSHDNIEMLFLALHVLGRWATLGALAWAMAELGLRDGLVRGAAVLSLALVLSVSLPPRLGGPELFINYFTHTPLATPLVLVGLVLATRRHFVAAFALLGVIASVNAFIAVWAGWTLAFVVGRRASFKEVALGLAIAGLLALPVAWWIAWALLHRSTLPAADYVEFLRVYFPDHFFLDASTPVEILRFLGVMAAGWGALQLLDAPAAWRRGYFALCLLVVLGALLPYVAPLPVLLDLQLLRASGIVQLLGLLAATVLAIRHLFGPDGHRLAGVVALCLMALLQESGLIQAMVLLAAVRLDSRRWDAALAGLAVGVAALTAYPNLLPMAAESVVVAGFIAARPILIASLPMRPRSALAMIGLFGLVVGATAMINNRTHWRPRFAAVGEIASWAQQSTPRDAVFLLAAPERPYFTVPFQLQSGRRLWVDWKRGAAALWQPSYYREWRERLAEVNALPDLEARLAYACRHRIDYVVDSADGSLAIAPAFANARYRIYSVRERCR